MKRYGLGLARPAPVNNDALVAAGYLHKADTPWASQSKKQGAFSAASCIALAKW